jgi:DNA primase
LYSSDTTKYLIRIHLVAEGVVEKPDVIGAIFGQTEGLLGEDFDLRDLQRTGRVGRIDVQITSKKGETKGEILISSSLDRAETAILAASLETIDRVGPCVAHVTVETIEDIRVTKRKKIVERAKDLLLEHFDEGSINADELLEGVRESLRVEKVSVIGEDRAPAGPNVADSDAIIVVEGRADVINLLRYGIKNSVAVEGTKVTQTIIDLCEKKTATAFLDGDRGGELILRELLQVADIDFVAYAPRGKSVEDLSRKEIVRALRNKIPVEYVREQFAEEEAETGPPSAPAEADPVSREREEDRRHKPAGNRRKRDTGRTPQTFADHLDAVRGHHIARFLSSDYTMLREIPSEDVEKALGDLDGDVAGLIVDGEVTQKILDLVVGKGLEYIAAREFRGIIKRPLSIRMIRIR